MPMLLFLWLISMLALWASAVHGFREAWAETDPDRRRTTVTAILLSAVPPSLVFLVSAFVLLQAAPTVQFNVGSPRAMSLWSFWVHCWPFLFVCSGLQIICYLIWGVVLMANRQRSAVRYAVGFGLLSSLLGSLLLIAAAPSA